MAKMRSPNYPSIGLPDAINEAQKIWAVEKKTAVRIDVLGKAMGYNSLSGPVRTKVAALRKYGLLNQNGGNYGLSELSTKIIHGRPEERDQALAIAAKRPEAFKELYDSHPNASDAALRSELIVHRQFTEAGAKQFIKAYRETLSIANPSLAGYSGPTDAGEEGAMSQASGTNELSASSDKAASHANAWTWTLSMPRNVRAELRIAGNVTKADIIRLEKQVKFLAETFDDDEVTGEGEDEQL